MLEDPQPTQSPSSPRNKIEALYSIAEQCGDFNSNSFGNRTSDSADDGDFQGPSNLSLGARRNSKNKKDKKIKSDRSENAVAVIGEVETIEQFQELLEQVTARCGVVRSHYYRSNQQCGFIYFHDEPTAIATKQAFDGFEFYGRTLKACAPQDYFDNELDALPIPPSSRRASKESTGALEQAGQRRSSDGAVANAGDPACTLVLKNLNFNMKQDKLIELLSQMGIPPQSVNYHYDQNGSFCGMAFAKYKRMEDAARALELLAGLEIGKRKLRVEYKRRKSSQPLTAPLTLPLTRPASGGLPAVIHESFDPNRMDTEQAVILSELLRFVENTSSHEYSFPPSLNMGQRTQVHIIADYLGLGHATVEVNDCRCVVVSKNMQPKESFPQPRQARHMSYDGAMFSLPSNLKQTTGEVRNTWPKAQFAQPKGPDGSKGFSFGRGRRVSTPAVLTPLGQRPPQPPPKSFSLLPTRSQTRSASVPAVVLVREGGEFSS